MSALHEWNDRLEEAPYDKALLLACGGVLVGHRSKEPVDGFEFADPSGAFLRPTHWMLTPELPGASGGTSASDMPRELTAEWIGYYFGLQHAANLNPVPAIAPEHAEGAGRAVNELRRTLDAEMRLVEARLPPGALEGWPH